MTDTSYEEIRFLRDMVARLNLRIATLEATQSGTFVLPEKAPCSDACHTLGHYGECDEHANEGFV